MANDQRGGRIFEFEEAFSKMSLSNISLPPEMWAHILQQSGFWSLGDYLVLRLVCHCWAELMWRAPLALEKGDSVIFALLPVRKLTCSEWQEKWIEHLPQLQVLHIAQVDFLIMLDLNLLPLEHLTLGASTCMVAIPTLRTLKVNGILWDIEGVFPCLQKITCQDLCPGMIASCPNLCTLVLTAAEVSLSEYTEEIKTHAQLETIISRGQIYRRPFDFGQKIFQEQEMPELEEQLDISRIMLFSGGDSFAVLEN